MDNFGMDVAQITALENRFITTRYTTDTVDRETAAMMVREIIRCHNHIARMNGEAIPFPDNQNRKPEKEGIGFNAERA